MTRTRDALTEAPATNSATKGRILARGGAIIINNKIITCDEGGIMTTNGDKYSVSNLDHGAPVNYGIAALSHSYIQKETYNIDTFTIENVAYFGSVIVFYSGIIHLPNVQLEKQNGAIVINECVHNGGRRKVYLFMVDVGKFILIDEYGRAVQTHYYPPTFELKSGDIFGNFKAKNATNIIAVKDGYIFQDKEAGPGDEALKFHELIILPSLWLFAFYILGVAIISFIFGFRMS